MQLGWKFHAAAGAPVVLLGAFAGWNILSNRDNAASAMARYCHETRACAGWRIQAVCNSPSLIGRDRNRARTIDVSAPSEQDARMVIASWLPECKIETIARSSTPNF